MEIITENMAIMLPVISAVFALAITALVHVLKHPNYRFGNKVMWIVVVLLIQVIGPIAYFIIGRGEENV
jgi:hypothetical protein